MDVEDLVALLAVKDGVLLPHFVQTDEALKTPIDQLLDETLAKSHVGRRLGGATGARLLPLPGVAAAAASRGLKRRHLSSGQGQLALYGSLRKD